MNAPSITTRSRLQVNRLVSAPVVAIGSFALMTAVPFLPGAPIFPLLLALGLGFLSIRSPRWVSATLLALSFFSITWQLLGFGLLQLFNTTAGSALAIVLLAILLVNPVSARENPAALAMTFLAVAMMLTPYYYLSIGLIVLATALGGSSSLPRVSITFVETLSPLLIVENALFFASPQNAARSPVIFAQLSNLAQNIRPALPGLNLYLTGIPQDFLSTYADSVVHFLASGAVSVLVVPILLLGIATTATVLVSGIIASRLTFLQFVNQARGIRIVFSPFVGSAIAPLPFIFLISIFSLPTIGGYQETLGVFESLFMVAGSFALAGVVAAKESFIWRFERTEVARTKILELAGKVRKLIDEGLIIIRRIISSAPSVNVSKESNAIEVDASYLNDVSRGVGNANYPSLVKWLGDIQQRLLPSMEALIGTLKSKVVNELERTSALARGYNNLLSEVGSPLSFSGTEGSYAGLDVEPAIREYDQMTSSVRKKSMQLYENYIGTIGSFNQLVNHAVGSPPVNPASLFDAHDYPGGMKLVVEEYWLNFHQKYQQDLQSRVASLRAAIGGLRGLLGPSQQERLDTIAGAILAARPSDATALLANMEKLRGLVRSAIDQEVMKVEDARKLITTLSPSGELVIGLEFTTRLEVLRPIQAMSQTTLLTFDEMTELITQATSTLAGVKAQERRDEEKLIVLAQYPVAKRMIDRLTRQDGTVPIGDLPFQRGASLLFMNLYASGSKDAKFDSVNEVLVVRSAKMR